MWVGVGWRGVGWVEVAVQVDGVVVGLGSGQNQNCYW